METAKRTTKPLNFSRLNRTKVEWKPRSIWEDCFSFNIVLIVPKWNGNKNIDHGPHSAPDRPVLIVPKWNGNNVLSIFLPAINCSLNRTKVEWKLVSFTSITWQPQGLNRTKVEWKPFFRWTSINPTSRS